MSSLLSKIFKASPDIRYVARYTNGVLESEVRDDLSDASSTESDRYEELLVNPTLLTLTQQRGDIDCGGLRFVLVRYGNFYQFVRPYREGHVSVCIAATAQPLAVIERIEEVLDAD